MRTKKQIKINKKLQDSLTSARRLLVYLINGYMKNEVSENVLKTMAHVLTKYGELYKNGKLEEIENKITELEKELKEV